MWFDLVWCFVGDLDLWFLVMIDLSDGLVVDVLNFCVVFGLDVWIEIVVLLISLVVCCV